MEKFPKTYIGRYPTAASLTAGRARVMSLARAVSTPTNNWAFVEETNTIWAQNKDGDWIDTGKAFIRTDTFKGNPLIADGTINWEMQGLKVFGKSKQDGTPSPDNPVPIVSTGDDGSVDLTIAGANLFNPDGAYDFKSGENKNGIVVTIKDDGSLVFDGESSNYSDFFFNIEQFKNLPKGSYTISIGSAKEKINIYASIGGKLYAGIKKDCVFETEPGITIGYIILRLQQSYSNYEVKINLNPGSVALSYHDYQSPQLLPIPTPNGLPGIPVDSGGNYTDETGQQWICDYVDFARGVKVQNTIVKNARDFTWKDAWNELWPFDGTLIINDNSSNKYDTIIAGFCNILQPKSIKNGSIGFTTVEGSGSLAIRVPTSFINNLEAWNNYIAQNNVIFILPLATPIETPLSQEELAAYQALTSYDGATNIFSDEEVGLEAELVTDKIDKEGYADPSAELSLYYAALAGFVSLSDVPMPSCRESELVRKLIDPEFELSFEVNDSSSRKEKYLWDLINGTTEMLSNNPLSNTEKFLHIMLGGEVSEYPVVHSELEYWMDVCATFYSKI